jgi:HEPN domain-containing protein
MALQDFGSQFKNGIAFAAQQCVEKALKGYLISRKQRPPKTHDIELLGKIVSESHQGLGQMAIKAKILTEYAVVYRYPDAEKKPITLAQAKAAVRKAQQIYDLSFRLVYGGHPKIKAPTRKSARKP